MSANAVEMALWQMARDGALARAFLADPDEMLAAYRVSHEEKSALKALNVKTLASWGIEHLLILQAWNAVMGPNCVEEYLVRMNG